MNVLGKIKSKKPKPQENPKKTQTIEVQEQFKQQKFNSLDLQDNAFEPLSKFKQSKSEEKSEFIQKPKATKPILNEEMTTNTNVISKKREKQIKKQDPELIKTSNSISNSFTSVFHSKKQSKKVGVHFEDIPSVRKNCINLNQHSNDRQKPSNHEDSMSNDDQFGFDFDFLLSQRQKKQIKKSLHLSRGKAENVKQIEEDLKQQNDEVLSFYIRKWNLYGDIYMFEGELQSHKRRYIEIQTQEGKLKVYDRIKVKLSCARQIIVAPQAIGRIFISDVIFLSENQAMIPPEYLLRTIEKGKRRAIHN